MLNTIIIVFLIFGFLMGLKRGLILQAVHLFGFIISFLVAVFNYKKLAPHLSLWIPYPEMSSDSTWGLFLQTLPLENAFYNGIAFVLIFFVTKIILQIIASMLDFIANLPVLNSVNSILGALLGFIEVYLIVFIVVYILGLMPIEFIQSTLDQSSVAQFIVDKTPYFSNKLKDLWFLTTVTD